MSFKVVDSHPNLKRIDLKNNTSPLEAPPPTDIQLPQHSGQGILLETLCTGSQLSHRVVKVGTDSFPTYLGTQISETERLWETAETVLKCVFATACLYTIISYVFVPLVLTSLSNLCIFVFISRIIAEKVQKSFYPFFNIRVEQETVESPVYPVSMHALRNSKESFEAKKQLIHQARDSVILSGNYCGRQALQEVLEILKTKLEIKANFKVIILSSSLFLTESNYRLIDQLNQYEHFHFVITDTVYAHTHEIHKTTNHIKGLVVDGRKAIIGGDGLENKYAYAEGIGDKRVECPRLKSEAEEEQSLGLMGSLAELVLPRGFRDFSHYIEGDEFCHHTTEQLYNFTKYWVQLYGRGYAEDKPINFAAEDCISHEAPLESPRVHTGKAEFFAVGPELSQNHLQARMIELVDLADDGNEIHIDHMYFQPTPPLMDALVAAANRGVRILIVTNGYDKNFSPKAHQSFGDLNRNAYLTLIERVEEDKRANVEVYEFGQKHTNTPRKTTNHKKVMVVETGDGEKYVIFGNGNLGYKSMAKQSDYEIGVIVKDRALADANIELIRDDAFQIKRICHDSQGQPIIHQSGRFVGREKKVPLSKKVWVGGQWHERWGKRGPKGPPPIDRVKLAVNSFLRPLNG